MIIGSKNKGDWSEFYVLLYLLGTRKLCAADEQLNKIGTFYFPINKIIRNDAPEQHVDFSLTGIDEVEIYFNEALIRKMTSNEFLEEAKMLYNDIPLGKGSFDIPHGEAFLNMIELKRLAAPPTDITDIKMELHDTNTGIDQTMGFSIKSYIGGPPTLLNASGATNFIYEVTGISSEKANEINNIETREKILDRIISIFSNGGKLTYQKISNENFSNNLLMIDSKMEEMLSELVKYSYCSNEKDCQNLIEYLEEINPLNFPRKGVYIYKFKQFLCAKALGMEPAKNWGGEDDANGGYIVAKSDGEVLAYHLYNRDRFKQYLYENVKLERPSTTRHNYAKIYEEDGKMYINLNLQIRFK